MILTHTKKMLDLENNKIYLHIDKNNLPIDYVIH